MGAWKGSRYTLRFTVALATLVTILLQPGRVDAFYYIGYYWNHYGNITTCDYTSDSNSSTAFYNGINAWNNVSGYTGYYLAPGYCGSADVNVYSGNHGANGWSGLTTFTNYSSPNCGAIIPSPSLSTHDKIDINTYYSNQSFYTNGARQSIVAHEFGHVAGLAHNNTTNPTPLMYYSDDRYFVYGGINTPQSDDQSGVRNLVLLCK